MDKIYKKYKKSGAYHRKLGKTREKYENTLQHLYSLSRSEVCRTSNLASEPTFSTTQHNVESRKPTSLNIEINSNVKLLFPYFR